MPFPKPVQSMAIAVSCLVTCVSGFGNEAFVPQGSEYGLSGSLPGDQVEAAVAIKPGGGILVWEDNFTDGDGSGISYRLLDSSFSGVLSSSKVNQITQGNQGKPAAAMLSDGGSIIVWEGATGGLQNIYARFLTASNTWATGDVQVNTYTNQPQEHPAVAGLDNGASVVVWSSYNQVGATSMKDVYFQRFSALGEKLGSPTRVNQTTALNQRTPAIARLSDGRFVVAWVNETGHSIGTSDEYYDVDIFARMYSSNGVAQGAEFKINTTSNLCANPSLAPDANGGFLVAWSQKNVSERDNGWDIVSRPVSGAGVGGGESLLNTYRYGDQFGPSAAAVGSDYMVVWTSLRQDGSHEGVFGRFVGSSGLPSGDEFQVNTTAVNKQLLPTVASDGGTRFLAVWSSFTGISDGFDIFGQRYSAAFEPLPPPGSPYVWALSDSMLKVSWAVVAGFDVANYEVYADGAATATQVTTNIWWNADGLAANSTHSYRLAYVLHDGRRSPLSPPASGHTYLGYYYFGIPVEWMDDNWGQSWPGAYVDSDGDGASNYAEFLAGTDPNDPSSVLRVSLVPTPQGIFLHWNTEPGKIYQVQRSTSISTWNDVGGLRFAPGNEDSMYVGGEAAGMFRVVLQRN